MVGRSCRAPAPVPPRLQRERHGQGFLHHSCEYGGLRPAGEVPAKTSEPPKYLERLRGWRASPKEFWMAEALGDTPGQGLTPRLAWPNVRPYSCTSSHRGSTASPGLGAPRHGAPRHLSQHQDLARGLAGQRGRGCVAGAGNQEAADVIFGCDRLDRSCSNKFPLNNWQKEGLHEIPICRAWKEI